MKECTVESINKLEREQMVLTPLLKQIERFVSIKHIRGCIYVTKSSIFSRIRFSSPEAVANFLSLNPGVNHRSCFNTKKTLIEEDPKKKEHKIRRLPSNSICNVFSSVSDQGFFNPDPNSRKNLGSRLKITFFMILTISNILLWKNHGSGSLL